MSNFFIDGEPNGVYQQRKNYVGRSELVKTWQRSYSHSQLPTEQTKALLMGSAIHDNTYAKLIGSHTYFDSQYVVKSVDRFKKGEKKQFELINGGKSILTRDEYLTVDAVTEAILAHKICKNLLEGAIFERSFYYADAYNGKCPIRARPDAIRIEDGIIIDFKSALDASPDSFGREVFSRYLDIQSAHYMKTCEGVLGQEFKNFMFIAAEKTAPFGVAVYNLDDEVMTHAKELHEKMITKYMVQKSEMIQGYPMVIQTITLPQWRKSL